jgi:EAL domain-containing protein (putative c-di-GMP-specific phosphodiesterase class I)
MARDLMRKFEALDTCLAIEDFGPGCVSSSNLPLYALDVFKIDHQCIDDLPAIPRGRTIVQAISALGRR